MKEKQEDNIAKLVQKYEEAHGTEATLEYLSKMTVSTLYKNQLGQVKVTSERGTVVATVSMPEEQTLLSGAEKLTIH